MSISFEGIGALHATFAGSSLGEGKVVKMKSSAEVQLCSAGDAFCGVVSAVSRDGGACSVQLAGFVTLPYTGTAPSVGYGALVANAAGGVAKPDENETGRSYLVAAVDTSEKTVTILL